jgi:CHAD domain-containing protein
MAKSKKWEIPRLAAEKKFKPAACRILSHRLHSVMELLVAFKHEKHDESVHQLRIAIRRLRYPLETMISQFDRTVILPFIEELNRLQDAAGIARDVDVLKARLAELDARYGWRLRKIVFIDLEDQRRGLYRQAADAIDIFSVSPALYDFKKEVRYADYEAEFLFRTPGSSAEPDVKPVHLDGEPS